jgi:hypothetical protein
MGNKNEQREEALFAPQRGTPRRSILSQNLYMYHKTCNLLVETEQDLRSETQKEIPSLGCKKEHDSQRQRNQLQLKLEAKRG